MVKDELKSITFPSRADVLAGRVEEVKKKPRRVIEMNMMMQAQEGPMWLRTEKGVGHDHDD